MPSLSAVDERRPKRKPRGRNYQMVPVRNLPRSAKPFYFERLISNEEIVQRNLRVSGRIKLRLMVQVFDYETGQFAGLRGKSLVVSFNRVQAMEKFLQELADWIGNFEAHNV